MKKITFAFFLFLSLGCYSQTHRPTQIAFENFEVTVVDFIVKNPAYFERLSNHGDTVVIVENPCFEDGEFIDNTVFRVSQKIRKDSFSLSFAYKVSLYESPNNSTDSPERWVYMSGFRTRPVEIKNEFMIPALNWKYYVAEMKKEYNLRDTIAPDPQRIHVPVPCFTRDTKVFFYSWDVMYLQIKRYEELKLKQTEYIEVRLLQKGCE